MSHPADTQRVTITGRLINFATVRLAAANESDSAKTEERQSLKAANNSGGAANNGWQRPSLKPRRKKNPAVDIKSTYLSAAKGKEETEEGAGVCKTRLLALAAAFIPAVSKSSTWDSGRFSSLLHSGGFYACPVWSEQNDQVSKFRWFRPNSCFLVQQKGGGLGPDQTEPRTVSFVKVLLAIVQKSWAKNPWVRANRGRKKADTNQTGLKIETQIILFCFATADKKKKAVASETDNHWREIA